VAKLSKSAAARHLQISRTTLYKLIEQGVLSATPDGMIDSAELVRVAPVVDSLKERTWTSMDSTPHPQEHQHDEQARHPMDSVHAQSWTPVHERERTSTLQDLVDTLREQMQLMRDELQAAREERALLLQMLQDMQHRYDRLLDAPRVPAPPPPAPTPTPARTSPPAGGARGAMRRRIVALLRDYPEGLTPAEIQRLLGVDRNLADTLSGMLRYRLVQRAEDGRYVAAAPG
jgi:hypothetical protein